MSTQSGTFHRTVVEDVLKNIREEFTNEGVDESVLEELRQAWENKLVQAGAYDFPNQPAVHNYAYDLSTYHYTTDTTQTQGVPNSLYLQNPYLGAATTAPRAAAPSLQQNPYLGAATTAPRAAGPSLHHVNAMSLLRSLNSAPANPLPSTTLPTTTTYATATTTLPNWNTQSTLPSLTTQYTQQQQQQQQQNIKQHDGANDEKDPTQERKKIDTILLKKFARAQKLKKLKEKADKANAASNPTSTPDAIPQFDGLGDRKAKDEDDDDDDEEDGSAKGDEELGSDLDDDDDEEEPDTEHIVLCQYEKVTRVKNKRKANLKDGIMHINGKDYVFSKATGEFDW